jgi:hypothetical protein
VSPFGVPGAEVWVRGSGTEPATSNLEHGTENIWNPEPGT